MKVVSRMGLGDKLRDARINKGYTLNTMQQMTKIQKKYLQAIEEEKYDEMPGTFYVRAFIKQYADVVGLNGDDLLEQYEQELDFDNVHDDAVTATGGDTLPKRSELTGSDEKNMTDVILSYMPMILLVIIIIIIIGTLIYAINSISNKEPINIPESSSVTSIVSLVEPDSTTSESTSRSSQTEETRRTTTELKEGQQRVGRQVITLISQPGEVPVFQLEDPINEYKFEIKGIDFVWAGIFEDGEIMIDQTVNADERVEYVANTTASKVTLNRGYPDGATFLVNDTVVELPEGQFIDSIQFVVGDETASTRSNTNNTRSTSTTDNDSNTSDTTTTTETETPAVTVEPNAGETATGETSTGTYQGPAVFDPNNE